MVVQYPLTFSGGKAILTNDPGSELMVLFLHSRWTVPEEPMYGASVEEYVQTGITQETMSTILLKLKLVLENYSPNAVVTDLSVVRDNKNRVLNVYVKYFVPPSQVDTFSYSVSYSNVGT